MALAMHVQRGYRLLVGSSKTTGGLRPTYRGVLVLAEWGQRNERGASSRAEGRRGGGGGGRREDYRSRGDRGSRRGQEQSGSSIWGDEWDLGGSSKDSTGGWLDADSQSSNSSGKDDSRGAPNRSRYGRDAEYSRGGRGGRYTARGDSSRGGSGYVRDADYNRSDRGGRYADRDGSGSRYADRDGSGSPGAGYSARGRGGERRQQPAQSFQRGGRESSRDWREERQRGRPSWEAGDDGADEEGVNDGEEYGRDYADRSSGSSSLKQLLVGDVLYGVSPVLAALQAGRREVHTLYLQDGMDLSKRKDKGAIQTAKRLAEGLGATVAYAPKHDLNMVADNRPHQGVVLDCSPLEFEPLNAMPPAPSGSSGEQGGRLPVWLCLDEVVDPQNFGAALRSAYFLGVAGVLTCHRNSAPLSAVVSKASAGAMELMPVHACKSLPATLADAKAKGWQVLGAAADPGSVSCAAFTLNQPSILVMGNEGYGVRPVVKRLCDAMLQIDAGGQQQAFVDSLNVSVATGILLHRLLTAQGQQPADAPEAAEAAQLLAGLKQPAA